MRYHSRHTQLATGLLHRSQWSRGVLCLALFALCGCGSGGDGLDRQPVNGAVTFAGDSVEAGSISFMPAKGHQGPAANGTITDGHYEFTEETGPVAGPHRVVIRINTETTKLVEPAKGPYAKPSQRERFEFEVAVPDAGPFEQDFELKDSL